MNSFLKTAIDLHVSYMPFPVRADADPVVIDMWNNKVDKIDQMVINDIGTRVFAMVNDANEALIHGTLKSSDLAEIRNGIAALINMATNYTKLVYCPALVAWKQQMDREDALMQDLAIA